MTIFDYDSYKLYVNAWIEAQPKRGRGLLTKIAGVLGVGTVLVSQIFRGGRDLNVEQALKLARFLKLTALETKFFVTMVQKERSASADARQFFERELKQLLLEAQKTKHRLPHAKELSIEAQAIFYSRWLYSAIRLATSIEGLNSVEKIAERLGLSRQEVSDAVDFLLQHGLCVRTKNGLAMGPKWTHLSPESPLIAQRQIAWRLRGFHRMEERNEEHLFFTSPLVLAEGDIPLIRKELLAAIERISKLVETSPSEELVCVNIDLFPI